MTPEVFAPAVVSTEKAELNSVFTPDGKEFYFTISTESGTWTIMVMKQIDGEWTKPQIAPFSGRHSDVDVFVFPDGRTLLYCSNRPADGQGPPREDFDIWMLERIGERWSEPRNLGAPINSPQNEFYPTVTRDGTMYFQSVRSDSRGGRDIYRAKLKDGVCDSVENLGDVINTRLSEGDALISPDGEFLLFSANRADGFGQGDLYVSFRAEDGSWTTPRNLGGKVNTAMNENCPVLSPDGKFLFYTSGGDIYWVSTAIIDEAKRGQTSAVRRN